MQAVGSGLQSGRRVRLTLHPAAADSGILFRRVDLPDTPAVRAIRDNLIDDPSSTALGRDGVLATGVEHLLAAFSGFGIDNVRVDLDAAEMPVLDGGAGLYAYLIQSAGLAQQPAAKRFLRVRRPVAVTDGNQYARLEPFEGFKVSLAIDVQSTSGAVETRSGGIDFAAGGFAQELQRVRALPGVDRELAVDTTEERVEQFLRHRVMSVIGDLYLLGRSLIGAFSGRGAGHALNRRLLAELSAQPSAWEEIVFEQEALNPISYISSTREI